MFKMLTVAYLTENKIRFLAFQENNTIKHKYAYLDQNVQNSKLFIDTKIIIFKIFLICCFSAKHAALRRKSKDWLAPNQNKMKEDFCIQTSRWIIPSKKGLTKLQ